MTSQPTAHDRTTVTNDGPLARVVARLRRRYPQADPAIVAHAVLHAHSGLVTCGLQDDEEAPALLAKVAELDLRQRLGGPPRPVAQQFPTPGDDADQPQPAAPLPE